ncbi:MAG: DUF6156 family protein [Caenispirillum sp.]|nr:DUF6156 family protein [Caenispirillum sp.]
MRAAAPPLPVPAGGSVRHFVTYSGIRLPLKLVTPLADDQLDNRNTFFRGTFDALGRLVACEKLVYGAVELTHRYAYHGDGPVLARAEVTGPDGEIKVMTFDETGAPAAG